MPVSLMKLKPWSCRFPLDGDESGAPKLFCGEPVDAGSPYCASHRKLCFVPPDRQQAPGVVSAACRERRAPEAPDGRVSGSSQ